MNEDAIEIVSSETVYQGFFRLDRHRLRHRLYSGEWSPVLTREVLERGHAAAAILYDPERDSVVLIEQFRLAAHLAGFPAWQIEVVAGIVDSDDPVAVAIREIGEETGVPIIGELIPIHRFLTSPGGTTETVSLFCAIVDSRGASGTHGLAAEHEDIRVAIKSYDEAMVLARDGTIANGFALLALYWLGQNRADLRRRSQS